MSFMAQLIGGLAALGIKKVDTSKLLPSGAVQHFARNTAPTGWLVCGGQAVSRTTYADLFAAIGTTFGAGDGSTTFNVPQLGGEFIRSWVSGQAVDPGRAFGSTQALSTENLYARIAAVGVQDLVSDPTVTPSWTPDLIGTSASIWAANAVARTAGVVVAPLNTGETRPVNVALLACIKT